MKGQRYSMGQSMVSRRINFARLFTDEKACMYFSVNRSFFAKGRVDVGPDGTISSLPQFSIGLEIQYAAADSDLSTECYYQKCVFAEEIGQVVLVTQKAGNSR